MKGKIVKKEIISTHFDYLMCQICPIFSILVIISFTTLEIGLISGHNAENKNERIF